MTIPNPQISAPGNVSEIQRLTAEADRLSHTVDSWNTWYIGLGLVAILVAFWVFFAQWRIIAKGRQLSAIQSDLIAAKNRELNADLSGKDIEIANLKIRSETAESSIASAQRDAAHAIEGAALANKLAEDERIARTKLEEKIAPRRLTGIQKAAFARVLMQHPVGNVVIISALLDTESLDFANDFDSAFKAAGWGVLRNAGRSTFEHGVSVGTLKGTTLSETGSISSALTEIRVSFKRETFSAGDQSFAGYFQPGTLYLVINHKEAIDVTAK